MSDFQQSQENPPTYRSLSQGEAHQIVIAGSQSEKLKLEVIETLIEPCDCRTYEDKLKEAAKKLGKSVRAVQRLIKEYEKEGLAALNDTTRSDKGQPRIDPFWKAFIIKTYEQGNKRSKLINPRQVFTRVQAKAEELGLEDYPKLRTVYRVLEPVIKSKEKKKIRSKDRYSSNLFMEEAETQVKELNLGIPSTEIDIAICKLVLCVSNFSDNHFDAFWLNLTEPEIEILIVKLINHLRGCLRSRKALKTITCQ